MNTTRIQGLVSIIMPAYNCEKFIQQAIDSVLQQTYEDFELLIIDDCSTDETQTICKLYNDDRIHYCRLEENSGCAAARNRGLALSKGEYIAFLDSDDTWNESKLERQLQGVHEYELCFTAYSIVDEDSRVQKNRTARAELTFADLLAENSVIFSTVLCRYEDIKDILFQAKWYHEDYVFLLDCVRAGIKIKGINELLCNYRVHSGGRSFNKSNAAKKRWIIYREYLKLNVFTSVYYFLQYAFYGVRKYL